MRKIDRPARQVDLTAKNDDILSVEGRYQCTMHVEVPRERIFPRGLCVMLGWTHFVLQRRGGVI